MLLYLFKALDVVALSDIVVAVDAHAALKAARDLSYVVFEAF